MSENIITAREVSKRVGLSRTSVWRLVKRGDFPPPLRLSSQRRGWIDREISEWLDARFQDAAR